MGNGPAGHPAGSSGTAYGNWYSDTYERHEPTASTPGATVAITEGEFEEALRALCDLDERLELVGNPADIEDWQTAIATVQDWLA